MFRTVLIAQLPTNQKSPQKEKITMEWKLFSCTKQILLYVLKIPEVKSQEQFPKYLLRRQKVLISQSNTNLLILQMFGVQSELIALISQLINAQKKQYQIFGEMRNIFQFCLFIICLVTIKAKSNAKFFSMMMSIEFWPNCNQTADK